jgi:hypothetical protein
VLEDQWGTLTIGLIVLVEGILVIRFPAEVVRWQTWGFVDGSNFKETMRFFGWVTLLVGLWLIGTVGWSLINHAGSL